MRPLNWLHNEKLHRDRCVDAASGIVPREVVEEVRWFHSQLPGFRETPLRSLTSMAEELGLGGIWVKDEAERCELSSFKVLGGAYAVYRLLKRRLGEDGPLSFSELTSQPVRERLGALTFAAATDGNHGRGVAWAASMLGQRAVIYMPRGTKQARIDAIRGHGADVRVIDGTYDDAVEQISRDAQRSGWLVVSDTAWEGYEEIPRWVIQGYTTMFSEAQQQLAEAGLSAPTHLLLQAGVGSLAVAGVSFYLGQLGQGAPKFVIVEPTKAACILESARAADGQPHKFPGNLDTIMAGLSCGQPNPLAWPVLRDCAEAFVSCPDFVAARGMRMYAAPLSGDPRVVSGESGAATLGALSFIMQAAGSTALRDSLRLDQKSQVLLINTEGATDPEHYRQVVWEGAHPVPPEAFDCAQT